MDDKVIYWIEMSDYDIETADAMLATGRYLYVGFMCHQTIEKILKAYWTKNLTEIPLKIHSLSRLAEKTGLSKQFTEEQLDFTVVYGSAKEGWMSTDWQKPTDSIIPLLDAIIEYIPEPEVLEGDAQMLITSLDFSSYVGRIAIGRVHRGELREGMDIALCKRDGSVVKQRIKELQDR